MKYSILAKTYEELESESGKLKKVDILSKLLSKTPKDILPKVVILASGKVFPTYSELKTGVASKMIMKAISKATGISQNEIVKKLKKSGDLGLVAEGCVRSKKQKVFLKKTLTVQMAFNNIQKLATITGKGSQEKKLNLIAELLVSSEPIEARYIVRTILETMRIGVAEGIIRDSIAKSFNVDAETVENAWFLKADYGEIAIIAKEKGERGLKHVKIELGKPIIIMLGEKSPTLKEALEKYEHPILEYKYDGMRAQIHKKNNKFWIFSRRLENVTNQFPDLLDFAKESIKMDECIIEGEVIGFDPKTGNPIPFQQLSRRVQRKYDIDRMIKKIPVRMFLFDIVYLNGKTLFDESYSERRKKLKKAIKEIPNKFELAQSLITKNLKEAEKFYKASLKENQEGLMVKNLDAKYQPGRRVGYWLKVKPIMETLELVIIGAEWGKGKRSNWLSSFTLACRDPDTGHYLSVGKLGTGFTDEQFQEFTKNLKHLITSERGVELKIKPDFVVEVAYEEIQKSPKYESGYALRFPRLQKIREDRRPEDCDTIDRVIELFKSQGKTG
jgi:DNA ligase-1